LIENLRRRLQIYGIAEAFPAEGGETMLSVRDIVKVALPEEIVAAVSASKLPHITSSCNYQFKNVSDHWLCQ
jgi:hypothetical protein